MYKLNFYPTINLQKRTLSIHIKPNDVLLQISHNVRNFDSPTKLTLSLKSHKSGKSKSTLRRIGAETARIYTGLKNMAFVHGTKEVLATITYYQDDIQGLDYSSCSPV